MHDSQKTKAQNVSEGIAQKKQAELVPSFSPDIEGAMLSDTVQRAAIDPDLLSTEDIMQLQTTIGNDAVAQLLSDSRPQPKATAVTQRKTDNSGMPNDLKTGVESLSGVSMEDVNVHYNSDKPSSLNALAYAQGTDIHIAPGQEKHLPHEAWHVAQQKKGQVSPTIEAKGVAINNDQHLEHEADVMGQKALTLQPKEKKRV